MLKEKTKQGLKKGYKPHIIVDAETEIPIAIEVLPANTNDKKLFDDYMRK